MSVNSAGETTMPSLKITYDESDSSIFEISRNLIIGIIFSVISVFVLLIIGICKYRNRDEGTYTIDETKNCGPFAEMDAPLNGSNRTNKKLAKNNRRKEISNKEWYV